MVVRLTYYFIDDFNDICRQKDGMSRDFAEVIDLVDLIEDINKLSEKNKEYKRAYNLCKFRRMNDANVIYCLEKEIEELKEELHEFKEYVFSDEEILCYSCVNCVSKGIYKIECSEKGKVDVHSTCFLYWKNEVMPND